MASLASGNMIGQHNAASANPPMRPFHRLPSHVLNGIAVALGIAVVQALVGAAAGPHVAQLALSGAVAASLADVPNTTPRTWRRVSTATLLSVMAALVAALLKPFPLALGAGVVAVTFVAMMSMAWGARAGAVSFAPILALVFAMAVPRSDMPALELAAWNGLGGVLYLGWSMLTGRLLQRRFRTLALVAALRAAAGLLRSRAALLEAPQPAARDPLVMQAWISGEAVLAERLQAARDFVFAEADSPRARRDTAVLLRTIDLRDVLLASRLDLDLLGRDDAARWMLQRVAAALRASGKALDKAADGLRDGAGAAARPSAHPPPTEDRFADPPFESDDSRLRLLPAVRGRLANIAADVARIQALVRGDQAPLPLSRAELQRFVAPEGWPLAALRAQLSLQSPVLRHAVRASLALGSAYFIALASPWASHPHWLVLSVAVVLRGNLEQTLSRRNARVLGTLLGCAAVLALSHLSSRPVLGAVFLVSVGIAHAFVLQRYWLTATAATVMALLQSHMVDPVHGFAIAERVGDTLLGAAMAWAFSYVLPSWERRNLPRAIDRVLKALSDYSGRTLTPGSVSPADAIEQRLARRQAYDALSDMASALQRSSAEPKAVQVPLRAVAALLDHGQRLMAHLSMVRVALSQGGAFLEAPAAQEALVRAEAALRGSLALADAAAPDTKVDGQVPSTDEVTDDAAVMLPMQAPADDALPWLLRRLNLLVRDGQTIRRAAAEALTTNTPTAAKTTP